MGEVSMTEMAGEALTAAAVETIARSGGPVAGRAGGHAHREHPTTSQTLNMVSAISAKSSLRFRVVEGRMNGERFIEFLKRLIHNAAWSIFLVVDGHPAHRAKIVTRVRGVH